MTKLEKLIKELCPNGVLYNSLDNYVDLHKGVQFNKEKTLKKGTYPVINGGIEPSGYIEQYNETENTITISQGGASAGYVNWLKRKFWAGAHCYILRPINEQVLNNRYLYHYIKSKEEELKQCQYGAGIPALAKSTIMALQIPLPPLAVQCEIVRILDEFTLLSTELAAELAARREQYEYYRDKLLNEYIEASKRMLLGDVCNSILSGKNQEKFTDGEYPVYGSTGIIRKTSKYVYDGPKILVSRVGANAGFVHMASGKYDVSENTLIVDIKNEYSLRYFYYLLVNMNLNQFAKGSGQLLITSGQLKNISIMVPPLEIQERIVNILDNFDAICSDLKIGLPAEIEKRQKQYEYYRDKLLTFKRKN